MSLVLIFPLDCSRQVSSLRIYIKVQYAKLASYNIMKNRQSRTTCSYFCSREIKNRNSLACNPDKTEEDHLCSCFQSITLPGID